MRYKITNNQLKTVINEVVLGELNKENLNEGVREWVLTGLITLSSLAGLTQSQPKKGRITTNDIRKAELVQQRLQDGDSTLINLLDKIDIERNKENLDKLKSVDIGTESTKVGTRNVSRVKALQKSGYSITDIMLEKDTIVTQNDVFKISSIIEFNLESDVVFGSGKYEIESTYLKNLMDTLNILINKGDIKNVLVVSSTDKEPIRMGNDKLSQLRSNSVVKFLSEIGVENIKVRNLPNQGPDLYHSEMSKVERVEARKETEKYRYVKLLVEFEEDVKPIKKEQFVEVVDRYRFELTRTLENNRLPPKTIKRKQSKVKTHKTSGTIKKCPPTGCFDF